VNKDDFQELIWQKGRELYRDMPWRDNTDPYYVLVSELMLQQTQVERVIPKFTTFIKRFPTVHDLAVAPLSDVLIVWNGLGYNRRAKFLHDAAKKAESDFNGEIPNDLAGLMSLPGVGPNTAGAIQAYSFNQPVTFIETNIRTVLFHHFFEDQISVDDSTLLQKLDEVLDREHPREFYWALMDYGSYLKKHGAGRINKSAHYKKQSALHGSVREVRGQIIKLLTKQELSNIQLRSLLQADERFDQALNGLIKDRLVSCSDSKYHLTK